MFTRDKSEDETVHVAVNYDRIFNSTLLVSPYCQTCACDMLICKETFFLYVGCVVFYARLIGITQTTYCGTARGGGKEGGNALKKNYYPVSC